VRVRLLPTVVRSAPRYVQLLSAAAALTAAGVVTPLVLVSAPAASAEQTQVQAQPEPTPSRTMQIATMALDAPTTVTRGLHAALIAHLAVAGAPLPSRPVQFVSRAPGAATWHSLDAVTTGADGSATYTVAKVNAATEYGAYYSDVEGLVRSSTASRVVHVIDMRPAVPRTVGYNAPVRLAGHLVQDAHRGLASQRVQVRFRNSASSAWSRATWVTTDGSGVAALTRRFTHSVQVGIRFPGAAGLAASPLAVASVTVKPRPATSSSGFRFPFLNPGQVQSPGSWSLDQGVDMFAQGEACGAAAKLVAVGNGTVIQTGISGFGPTAPVIRMSSGPFKGRNVYYGHTGRIFVHVGQQVRIGQLVAEIGCGQVGYSAGPHLEIGVGEPGGPPCCPPMHATASQMYRQLVAALRT
jgi:murein DD-endopeptidase MepM/ murein hydrolase activator NlpD